MLGTSRFKRDGGCRRTFHMVPGEIKQPELHKQFKFVGDVAFRASHRKHNQAVRRSSTRKEHDVPIKEHMLMSNLTTPRLPSLSMSRGSLKPEILGLVVLHARKHRVLTGVVKQVHFASLAFLFNQ